MKCKGHARPLDSADWVGGSTSLNPSLAPGLAPDGRLNPPAPTRRRDPRLLVSRGRFKSPAFHAHAIVFFTWALCAQLCNLHYVASKNNIGPVLFSGTQMNMNEMVYFSMSIYTVK